MLAPDDESAGFETWRPGVARKVVIEGHADEQGTREYNLALGERTAQLIPNNCSLFINIGTTTEEVARALSGHQGLRIITNNLNVAAIVSGNQDFEVIVAGVIRERQRVRIHYCHKAGFSPAMGGVHAVECLVSRGAVPRRDQECICLGDPLRCLLRQRAIASGDGFRLGRFAAPLSRLDVLWAVAEGLVHSDTQPGPIRHCQSAVHAIATPTIELDAQKPDIGAWLQRSRRSP